ncbi:Ger(x)C family spore germination protein [Numidum massiliense]|uniref:Ger(x)C family spore germination protein n=1 Tax=Numidum massiliense TaxID=1522315 RepID=UPI0006D55356|nr:Ger(x)C family spore germination protein [Numidum massiliense]
MKAKIVSVFLCVSLVCTAGCWDQRMLRDYTIVRGFGLDLAADGRILVTCSLPNFTKMVQSQSIVVSGVGDTPADAFEVIDRKVAKEIDRSNNRLIFIGEELVKKRGMYPLLDFLYRSPRDSLNAHLAIVQGRANDFKKAQVGEATLLADYLDDLIKSAELSTQIPIVNVQSVSPLFFNPGEDAFLPYVQCHDNEASVNGIALFNGQRLSGKLSFDEAMLFLLLADRKGREAKLTHRVKMGGKKRDLNPFITVNVESMKRKLKVSVSKTGQPSSDLRLLLRVNVIEFPRDQLNNAREVQALNEQLSRYFTERAQAVVRKLQQANCDALGIGRRLIAFHFDTWKKLDWKKTYPHMTITPHVTVEIVKRGIID